MGRAAARSRIRGLPGFLDKSAGLSCHKQDHPIREFESVFLLFPVPLNYRNSVAYGQQPLNQNNLYQAVRHSYFTKLCVTKEHSNKR